MGQRSSKSKKLESTRTKTGRGARPRQHTVNTLRDESLVTLSRSGSLDTEKVGLSDPKNRFLLAKQQGFAGGIEGSEQLYMTKKFGRQYIYIYFQYFLTTMITCVFSPQKAIWRSSKSLSRCGKVDLLDTLKTL